METTRKSQGARAEAMSCRKKILLLLLILVAVPVAARAQDEDWRTRAERSDYRETARYGETVDYCRRLERAAPRWVRFTAYGTSPEGRALPLLIISKHGDFTAAAARRAGRPIVLIQSGIHAGEIDGKDASLALARDIVITKKHAALADHAIVLIIPIYNVDGHERFGAFNRINQQGPEEMGWRVTAQQLNLNRDYMKADAPETRALIALFNEWRPDLYIDNHVTDGADYQYELLFTAETQGYMGKEVADYNAQVLQPQIRAGLERAGHITEHYFDLRDTKDPSKGLDTYIFTPRFSNGYGALRNRPTILVETHMNKPYKTRVIATYDLLVETLRVVGGSAQQLMQAVRAADEATSRLGNSYDATRKVPLLFDQTEKSRPFTFRGKEFRIELSEVSGDARVIYGDRPRDIETVIYEEFQETAAVAPPLAYIIPPAWQAVIDRLRAHGVRLERLSEEVSAEFETYRFSNAKWQENPYEGRHPATFMTRAVVERRTLPKGSVVVRLNDPLAKIVIHLLEPAAPDSLVQWGFFDGIFEQKEYAESYVLEKLAREMMETDPKLRAEFMERLRSDAAFRGSAAARLRFFYERSPYFDSFKNAYPVVRVTKPLDLKTEKF